MDRAEFIKYLLKKRKINKEVIEKSKEINDFPAAYKIIISIDQSDFINLILNPKRFGEIDLAAGDLKKHNLIKNSEYKQEAIKFIDDLSKQSKIQFNFENYNNSSKNQKNTDKGQNKILGIDLGTTNTLASIIENGKAVVIPLKNGQRILPSVISVNKKNNFEIGHNALRQQLINPEETFFSIKRFIGRRSSEFNPSLINEYPFKIDIEQEKLGIYSKRLNRRFECEELSAQVLLTIKSNAERYLDQPIQECVITVPAYFDNNQRVATKKAAEIAGLSVKRLISEPTAAAFAYGISKEDKNSITLVLDLGGGTFDISLVRTDGEELDSFSVIAHSGERDLGGDDFTNVLISSITKSITKEHPTVNINSSIKSLIREEATKAKHLISFEDDIEINFPMLPTKDNQIKSHTYLLTKANFERLCKKLNKKIEDTIKNFLEFKKVKKYKFQKVVLVGGASRMSTFAKIVKTLTNLEPQININPDEIVSHGAAYCAEYTLSNIPEKTVIDVTPLSLGVEVFGNIHSEIIPANTNLPCKKSEEYTTIYDYQKVIDIKVFQGNRKLASDNVLLKQFRLDKIEKAKAAIPNIEVTFEIDIDGILKVDALDKVTNSKNSILINNSLDMSEEEVERLRSIAIQMSDEDTRKLHFAKKCNELYSWKRVFEDLNKPKLSFNEKLFIEKVDDCLENLHDSPEDPSDLIRKLRKIIEKQNEYSN